MGMTRRDKELIQYWNSVTDDFPDKSEEWQMQMALEQFNLSNPNNPADVSDLMDALERSGDE